MDSYCIFALVSNFIIIILLARSLFNANEKEKRDSELQNDIQRSTDLFISGIKAAYIPAQKGSMCDATPIPGNGILYSAVNNRVAWLRVRDDGNAWMFVKLADSQTWAPMVRATMQDIADAIASKIPDDQALAIKVDEYKRQLKYSDYDSEQMIKTYSPL